ncbi:ceramide kinase-like [Gigantopelta aegis]|uniref:ceramide kinase-like n=1 Tax=Gigantopelta aegis TaxID=1735272 RepID=UPI001B88DD20|nr:ceramide kinase-like [Gigantopelta aegis]
MERALIDEWQQILANVIRRLKSSMRRCVMACIDAQDGWRKVKGKFVAINSYSMSCRCQMTPDGVSPASHLGDGCIDLVLVSNCSRVDYIRHLYRCTDRNSDQFNFDFIKVFRVNEFKFEPPSYSDCAEDEDEVNTIEILNKSMQHSVWNCDGEIVEFPSLHVRVHCQLIPLFARGVEEEEKVLVTQLCA